MAYACRCLAENSLRTVRKQKNQEGIHAPGSPFKIPVEGKELGGNGYNETSTVKIDAVAKTSKGTVAVVPEYQGDASKVTAKGAGLNKFFPGRPAAFQIDTG
uniref:Uncharacterized protein n=1 Tax=Caenorhabditis japonica TaxID=281687 RepID=A0A8R1IZM8_CAEJA